MVFEASADGAQTAKCKEYVQKTVLATRPMRTNVARTFLIRTKWASCLRPPSAVAMASEIICCC